MEERNGVWRVAVDSGGTFTDCLAWTPSGQRRRLKLLSSSAIRGRCREEQGTRLLVDLGLSGRRGLFDGYSASGLRTGKRGAACSITASHEVQTGIWDLVVARPGVGERGGVVEISSCEPAPLFAARAVSNTGLAEALPPMEIRLATTWGTNALLERRGAKVALFITEGFADLLRIGDQTRPDIFATQIKRPPPLTWSVHEVSGRIGAAGERLRPLVAAQVAKEIAAACADGVDSAAVVLMHSYRDRGDEQILEGLLVESGFSQVSVSSSLSPTIGLLSRAETTVVDAYLGPLLGVYLETVSAAASGCCLVMTSAGGMVPAASYRAKDSLLSGPAGGVRGAAVAARSASFDRWLGFDMGGTSTDVSRFEGDFVFDFEHRVGDARISAPALAIRTVAAGGGSVCWGDQGRLRVGPQSAGAEPGPACYGLGGPLTITDVNLLLGRLSPAQFEIPIDSQASNVRADELSSALDLPVPDLLLGALRIANERMAEAIRQVSVRAGYDCRDYVLVAFGGAGPQHACAVSELLDIAKILIPPDCSLLSACGLECSSREEFASRQILRPLEELSAEEIQRKLGEIEDEARRRLLPQGIHGEISTNVSMAGATAVRFRRIARMRFVGQDSTLDCDFDEPGHLARLFLDRYQAVFGYLPSRAVELESLRVVAGLDQPALLNATEVRGPKTALQSHATAPSDAGSERAGRMDQRARDSLVPGERLDGPLLVTERRTTTVVEPGWHVTILPEGALVLGR